MKLEYRETFMPREDNCFFQSIECKIVIVASYDRRFEESLPMIKNIMNKLQEQLPNCSFYYNIEHHLDMLILIQKTKNL